jgi:hypothetical protein
MSLDKTNTTLQKVYTIDFSFKNKSCLSTNELQSVKKYSKEAEKKVPSELLGFTLGLTLL